MRAAPICVSLALAFTLSAYAQPPAGQAPAQQPPAPVERAAPPAAPQAPAPGSPEAATPTNTLTRNVRLVILDAVVIDKKGNAVTDLKREDFHITEDDDPQQIRNFELPGRFTPSPDVTIESTADLDRLAPRAPVNIVLLDEFNTRFEDMAFARYSLKKWLEKQPAKMDTPTMLVAVSLSKFEVLRDYTQNKDEIIAALDHHFVAYPWQAHQFAWVSERYATAFLTLRRVAEAVIGHQGAKNMIWLGRGFPTLDRARFSVDDESRINSAVQLTVNELRDARVTLYTIDPAGVMIDPGVYGMAAKLFAPFGGDPDFQSLARATGGRNLYGRNDVDAEIGTSIRDGASIYTMTYRPTDDDPDVTKFRKIKVTVDRPGLTVMTRQGYFLDRHPPRLGKDGEVGRRLATELVNAGNSNMAYDSVPFTVHSDAASPNAYRIHIEPRGLAWYFSRDADERRTTKIILMVTTFDKKSKPLKADAKAFQIKAPSSAPATGRLNLPIDLDYTLEPQPKAVRARIVVRVEANGRMGTADFALGQPADASSYGAPATATAAPAPMPAGGATNQP